MRNPLLVVLVTVFVLGASLAADSVAQAPKPSPQTPPPPVQVEHPPGPSIPEPKPSGWLSALRGLVLSPSAGMEDYQQGRFSAAFAEFLRGYSGKEQAAGSGFNLALTAHRLGLWDKAEGLWRKFITSSPESPQALVHYNLGNALVASGKLDGALAAFQRALEIDPELGQAARNLRYTQKLKEHLDRKAQQSKQQQKSQNNQQQQRQQQPQDQQHKQGQKPNDSQQQQPQQQKGQDPQHNKQKPDKDGKNEAQDPKGKKDQDSAKGQDKNSSSKDDKDKSNTNGDDKEGPSTDKGRSQRQKAWQQQKSLNQRNSERLLESIEEDRKNYLKRKLRPSSRDQSGGKTW